MTASELQAPFIVSLVALILLMRVRTRHPPRWLQHHRLAQVYSSSPRSRRRLLAPAAKAVATAVVVGVLPWPVYLIARPHVHTSAEALLIATGIPLLWALTRCVRRRRLDAAAVIVIAAYAAAVGLSLLFGNAVLPLKLRDVAALAVIALSCLISAAIGRPLLLAGLQIIAGDADSDHAGALKQRLADPATRRDLGAATALAGALFLLAAAAETLLALTVSTPTFLAIAGPLGGIIPLAVIIAAIALLRHRARQRPQHRPQPGTDASQERHPPRSSGPESFPDSPMRGSATDPAPINPDKPRHPSTPTNPAAE
ncbi:hypothetical protein CVV68_18100 [Arthrobacter livingstonensis]|uniref:Uncharacterized protein n=1 Tax=Arthrobacter livingstonensis TaxID=670078 RepID=A0A2V5L7A8_9MICC|nr:VC0807 family protein [Arthrobacter livingstonensis]PYI65483.1 hypothetical protein CVV68_18100 [Arthrobacter livingstonensis]